MVALAAAVALFVRGWSLRGGRLSCRGFCSWRGCCVAAPGAGAVPAPGAARRRALARRRLRTGSMLATWSWNLPPGGRRSRCLPSRPPRPRSRPPRPPRSLSRRGRGSSRTSMSIISRRASFLPVTFSMASIYLSSRWRGQHIGLAAAPGAAGAADAVDIIVGMDRHVEIEDMADRRHVQAARRHVGGDQDLQFAGAEPVQGLGAQRLVEIAMDRRGVEAVLGQRSWPPHPRRACGCRRRWRCSGSARPRGSGGAAPRAWPSHWRESSTSSWVMLVAVVAGRETSMRTGLCRNWSVRRWISGGMVAE